jgi:DivIVA domain-containing protein
MIEPGPIGAGMAMESTALPADKRVWRLTWPGRLLAAGFAAFFGMVTVISLVAHASVGVHLLAAPFAGCMVVAVCVLRSKVVLTGDALLIRNPFDVHRIPLSQVKSVTNLPRGSIKLTTVDGLRIEIFAVHTPTLAWSMRRRSRANQLMEAIEDAHAEIDQRSLSSRSPLAAGADASGAEDGHRFPIRAWYPGYRPSEVDALITRIECTLSAATEPDRAVTAADVRAARFGMTRRGGYDQSTVDEALEAYAERLEWAERG